MHIFITGIAGFLGSNLADYYLKKGFKVSGCDNLVGGSLDNIDQSKIKFYKINCEDLKSLSEAMKGVDIVVTGSVSVFTAAIKNNVKRVVYCSSMARYGDVKVPFKEDDKINPVDPYGVSKVAAENILKILSKTHKFEYNIAVPHNIIGPKQTYTDPYRNVVSIMANLMLQNRKPIIYGDGEQKRCFSDIDDCIFCLDKLMMDKKIVNQTVNIGPDEEFITINQLFELLSNKLKFNQKPEYYEDRPNEVKHAVCSADKARNILGYETKVSLSESLDKVIDFIKIKGPKKFEYNYELEILNEKTPKSWKEKLF